MRYPSDKDIEQAKAYLRERLSAEISMKNNLEELLVKAAKDIAAIASKYNISPNKFRFSANRKMKQEIDEVLKQLRQLIEEYTETLAVARHEENREEILAFITGERYGSTLVKRIREHVSEYRTELEAAIAASLAGEISKSDITKVATASKPQRALEKLTRHTIAEGWMYNYWLNAERKGAVGFQTFRGSSYPCSTCSDYTMYIHPMSDPFPPLHVNCKCFMVFIYPV